MPDAANLDRLRLYNLFMAALHAIQGGLVVALSNDFVLPSRATAVADRDPTATPGVCRG